MFTIKRTLPLYAAPLVAASMLGFAVSGCGKSEQAQAADTPADKTGEKTSIITANAVMANVSRVVALGRVEPEAKISPLSMDVSGVVQKIFVREGQHVQAGEPLLELAHEVENAKLALAQSKAGTQTSEIASIQASLASAKLKAQNYKERFERLQKLLQSGAETQQNTDNARTDYETAAREVERLQANLQSAQSRLVELNADTRVAQVELSKKLLRSPAAGTLLSLSPTLGASVQSGTAVADFAPDGAVTVICEVDELFVDKIQLGQKATIRPQGATETLAEGVVMTVSPYLKKKSIFSDEAGALEDRRVREVRVKLNTTANLLFNSRVECVIAVK
jgi:multidrug efflux pump subunit AcrA (membrane-fusion protein)